jgi:hypothetical protein
VGFSYGQRVKILSGKYVGLSGMVLDSTTTSDELPLPQAGHYWIKILLHNHSIPVHVREDDIQAEPPAMCLEHDAIYITPDGRRFRAELDTRRYGEHRSWTLIPCGDDDSGALWRDTLERMLLLEGDRIVRLDFASATQVVDTGWTAADLRRDV